MSGWGNGMNMHVSRKSPVALDRRAERLVVLGLRGWLAGYETGDIACWEAVWNDYCRELGPARAKKVVAELAGLIRVLRSESRRTIESYPRPCRFMCRDECLALRLLSGCQQGQRPLACETACRLMACPLMTSLGIAELVAAAECYASELAEAGLELEPVSDEILAALEERPAPAALS